jgi:glycosyltransferase involved in cell wall biosynthesis
MISDGRRVKDEKKRGGTRDRGVLKCTLPGAPLISIILPVFNGGATLAEAIASVTCQSYDNIELIVVDGASSDNSLDIIMENEDSIDIWTSQPDLGVYDAMNKGLDLANGDWLYFLGSDDVLLDVLHKAVPYLKDPSAIYYGDVLLASGRMTFDGFNRHRIIRRNIPHQAIVYPRGVFRKYRYDLKYPVAADYHLNLRCFGDSSFSFVKIPCVLALFNDSAGLSSTRNDDAFAADKPRLVREHLGYRAYLELTIRSGLKNLENTLFRKGYRRLTGRSQATRKDAGRSR